MSLKRWLSILLLVPFGIAVVGCNTMRGVGEDVEGAGGAISEEATEQQQR